MSSQRGTRRLQDKMWLERIRSSRTLSRFEVEVPGLSRAVDEFNRHDFWRCHETLEEIWLSSQYPSKLFYQGLLKVAVGFHHVRARNRRGAAIKLAQGIELLEPFALETEWNWLVNLIRESRVWLQMVASEELDWTRLERTPAPRITLED